MAEPDGARLRLALLEDRLQQRRLARAVRAHECDVLTALDRERHVVEQEALADRHPQSFGLDDGAAASGRFQELEPEPPALAAQQVDLACRFRALPLETFDLLQLDLCLAGHLLGRRAEPRDEALEPFDVAADAARRLRSGVQSCGLLAPPLVPRTSEVRGAPRLELEHGVRDGLEEPAVVRDDEDAGVERLQLSLEPLEAFDVQVVRGLVEEEEVRVAPERARQRCPRQLAAGERLQLPVELLVAETEPAKNRRRALSPVVTARVLQARLRLAVAAHRRRRVVAGRHRLLEPSQLGFELEEVGSAREYVLAQGEPALQGRALIVKRSTCSLLEDELAALKARLADERPQQRRLPGSVRP